MHYDDHAPPHFHVAYGEYGAQIAIDTLEVVRGALPRRVLALVAEWAIAHREELRTDWCLSGEHKKLIPIAPLE